MTREEPLARFGGPRLTISGNDFTWSESINMLQADIGLDLHREREARQRD